MPKGKDKPRNKKATLNSKKIVVLTVAGLLLLSAIGYFAWNKYDQRRMTDDLNESGVSLDALANKLKAIDSSIEPDRTNFCYRASRKFSKGPIHCTQRVNFERSNVDTRLMTEEYDEIEKTLTSFKDLGFTKRQSPKNGNPLYWYYVANTKHRSGGCGATISGNAEGKYYRFSVECTSGDFDKFIYPEG